MGQPGLNSVLGERTCGDLPWAFLCRKGCLCRSSFRSQVLFYGFQDGIREPEGCRARVLCTSCAWHIKTTRLRRHKESAYTDSASLELWRPQSFFVHTLGLSPAAQVCRSVAVPRATALPASNCQACRNTAPATAEAPQHGPKCKAQHTHACAWLETRGCCSYSERLEEGKAASASACFA